ncbi:hypothetical protein E2542_SST09556 [Spatholobus suberectus]|nr:hypothetical protein E2542_SST09556 [Spatholobus suberectus]
MRHQVIMMELLKKGFELVNRDQRQKLGSKVKDGADSAMVGKFDKANLLYIEEYSDSEDSQDTESSSS